ncbi:cysteine-rich receptor-like protein kinase 2 [Arachis stenosperma]|uniref:cysteine-rich receptor-like protein kinase 2 n=1 Tax=Arachis stenosperma TaxID=217475 RepID=UPI0025AD80EF|nr:cysteine-rich receptor-like protein kinase 2 [Arachis stenosperma]
MLKSLPLSLLKVLALIFKIWSWWTLLLLMFEGALGDPQINSLIKACGKLVPTISLINFKKILNATLEDLRNQSTRKNYFGTSHNVMGDDTVYGMFQCRRYLSNTDCAACVAAATADILSCSGGISSHLVYDGCSLRYGPFSFFTDAIRGVNGILCGNQTSKGETNKDDFSEEVKQVLNKLQIATPKIPNYYAATKTQSIYAIAQCVETVSANSCHACLNRGFNDIQGCLTYTDGREYDAGCFMRYSHKPFFADNQIIDITPFLDKGDSRKKLYIIFGVLGGVALIIMVFFGFFKKTMRVPKGEIPGATKLKAPINYKYNDLKAATNNFNEENRLGGGGFGNVYKGTLKNGKVIAAKKLFSGQSKKLEDDFESEVKFLSNVHHRNLVRLLGFCKKGQERIIVYEYMTNGSLDKLLFGKKKGWLNWKQRYDMVLGTARGLAYLHEEFYVSIIHRDIKSGNILLDHELQPKISDFGLARFLPSDQSKLNTRFAGTLGYTAPEYAIYGHLSEKVDTYSYGIVVLEIISGQKSTEIVKNNNNDDDDHEYLIKQAWKLYEQGKHLELVDKNLDPNDYDAEEVKRVIEIALMCTQASPSKRPKMTQVVVLLTSKAQFENLQPSMPVFIESNLKSQGSNFGSNATVSDSILSAR